MILLTSASEIVSWVVLAFFIGISIFFIYTTWKKNPDKAEKELQDFLDSIQNIMKEHIITAINTFDFSKAKDSLIEAQETFFNNVLDDIFNLCYAELDELNGSFENKILYSLIKKTITKEKIREYVLVLFSQDEIQNKLTEMYNIALSEKMEAIIEEEKTLEEEYENYEKDNYVKENEVPVLDPKVDTTNPVEEVIIPPVEEESDTISADDPTIEIVETETIL